MNAAWDAERLLAPWLVDPRLAGLRVSGLTLDSRGVEPGFVFLAVRGSRHHGLDFLDQALAAGAAVVLWEPDGRQDATAVAMRCAESGAIDLRRAGLRALVSAMAARFHGDPGRDLRVIAVTGTDGKTSVAHYTAQLLQALEGDSAAMGTLGWGRLDDLHPSRHTTSDPVTVQARLAALRDAGVRSVAMEVSSHALVEHRVDAVPFDIAILTHVGRDHLDYHGSVESYRAAKRRLFAWPGLRRQVLNLDDAVGRDLAARPLGDAEILSYAIDHPADLALMDIEPRPDGLALTVSHRGRRHALALPLFGVFNALNALAALGAITDADLTPAALEAAAHLRPVPGRMERFMAPNAPLVVVDYAHTAGALEAALKALRPHVTGHLWCVFGCGGDRDTGKRPLMGEVAARLADRVVLTSDNPRSEDPQSIIDAIRVGMAGQTDCRAVIDRAAAIAMAIAEAAPEDGVLVAGKGHETEQVIGTTAHPFSDRDRVRDLLRQRAA